MRTSLSGFKVLAAALIAGPLLLGLVGSRRILLSKKNKGANAHNASFVFDITLGANSRRCKMLSPFGPWESVPGKAKASTVDTAGLKQSAWYRTVIADIAKKSYYIAAGDGGGAVSTNPAQGLKTGYAADGFELSPLAEPAVLNVPGQAQRIKNKEGWRFGLHINGLYADGKLACTPKANSVQELKEGEADFLVSDMLTVQYQNTDAGIRQNFIVKKAPAGAAKELRVSMQAPKGWTVGNEDGKELHFVKQNGKELDTKIIYKELKVWDADNRPLAACMGTNGNGSVYITVASAGAKYPVTIDPISTTAATTLTGTGAQYFGESIASAGDVNGDGYSDIVIGSSSDKAFIYLGSSTGLSTTATTLNAPVGGGSYGKFVASAGDLNGDGYSDVVVGAYGVSTGRGAAYIYLGSATGLPASPSVTLVEPESSYGYPYYQFGQSVASAGDVNGDGYGDLIIGAPLTNANAGAAYVYMGSAAGLSSTTPSVIYSGNTDNGSLGTCVSSAGDLNGDGYGDVAIGAPVENGAKGIVYIYMGSANGLSSTAAVTLNPGGQDNAYGSFGASIAPAGDVNGDGYGDLVIGANGYNSVGRACIYLGRAGGISATSVTILPAVSGDGAFGLSVASGDMNGDGYSDVVVGSQHTAHIYLGSAAGVPSTPTYTLTSPITSNNYFGAYLAAAGDVDGDGLSDMVVSDYNNSVGYIYRGSMDGVSQTAATATLNGFASPSGTGSQFGTGLASAGDINGDGYADVVIGAFNDVTGSGSTTGMAYIYLGSSTGLSSTPATTLNSSSLNVIGFGYGVASAGDVNGDGYGDVVIGAISSNQAFVYLGSSAGLSTAPATSLADPTSPTGNPYTAYGGSVASAGDVNGDGYGDLIIGATYGGKAYLYLGSATGIPSVASATYSGASGSYFGSVSSAGDINGDGYGDVVIGAYAAASNLGQAYIYMGSATGLSATAAVTLTGPSSGSAFGAGAAPAGDVNGDGYGDVVIPASGANTVYVFQGSATGLSTTAAITLTGASGSNFGRRAISAGDVNGDGYSDVVVGAWGASSSTGAAYIYLGFPSGLSSTASFTLAGTVGSGRFGYCVAPAGDVNGDGYSDILVGAPTVSSNTGAAYLFAGNGGYGKTNDRLRLYNTDLSSPLGHSNASATQFGVGLFVRPFPGATRARIVWETEPAGTGFRHNSPITNYAGYTAGQSSYTAIPAAGTELKSLVSKASGKATKVRVRLQYLSTQLPGGQTFGPWLYPQQSVSNGSGIVLPITLLSFNAVASGSGNLVAWQVAEEGPSTFYDVQRSADGVSFSKIGSSVTGKGSNSSYTFHDGSPLSPVSYYRLKGTEADGHVTYSGIAAVRRDGAAVTVSASPNPFTGSVTVTNGDADLNGRAASVVDMLGRTVATFTMSAQTVLDTKGWPAGMYVLRLPDGSTKKVVKR